jgi:hypothetical protein
MTSTTRAPARRLFRLRCEAPEIHVRRRGEIGKDRPHCDRLSELLRVYLVKRIVGGVVGVEIIKPVLAQRYHWHAGFLEFADILLAAKGWPAIQVGAERRDDPAQRKAIPLSIGRRWTRSNSFRVRPKFN